MLQNRRGFRTDDLDELMDSAIPFRPPTLVLRRGEAIFCFPGGSVGSQLSYVGAFRLFDDANAKRLAWDGWRELAVSGAIESIPLELRSITLC